VIAGVRAFRPAPPWWSGDLQTLRNAVMRPAAPLDGWACRRLWLPLGDGDALAAALHAPERAGAAPLIVLIHGLTGCEDSPYIRVSTRFWLHEGYPVLRLNLRGSVPSRPGCRGHYHAGRSGDIRAALHALTGQVPAATHAGLVAVGYSLGGNVLVKLLAEAGRELDVVAAATVSAPIDLAATSRRFHRARNALYRRWLLELVRREALTPPAEVSARERAVVEGARSLRAFDDGFIAPRFGFADCWDYYAQCSAQRFLAAVPVPTLLLHAADDPWIPVQPFRDAPWSANPLLTPVLTRRGGHTGFHAAGQSWPWHDTRIAAFLRTGASPLGATAPAAHASAQPCDADSR